MSDHYYAVIMAGGGGTRLWPLSRRQTPKQLLNLFDDRSLFQTSVDRLRGVFPPERILVVTVKDQAPALQRQCPEIPVRNFLIEPMPRGTASVVGLAAAVLRSRDPEAVMAILTADHFIGNEDRFRELLRAAHAVALDGYLVTLGIEPTFPATGVGYVQRGEKIGQYNGVDVYHVIGFKEKPGESQAVSMLQSGDHAWNSGMFFWQVERILVEFEVQMPDLASRLEEIGQTWGTSAGDDVLNRLWPGFRSETIDYGIMECAHNVAMLPASGLSWSDVGSWDSLFDLLDGDADGNIIMAGNHIGLETENTLIHGDQPRRLIVTIGVNDLVVVDTEDVLLVCDREQAQHIRQVVNMLKQDRSEFL